MVERLSAKMFARVRKANHPRPTWFFSAAARFAEQAKNLKIQPDERDHQRESAIPIHVFRGTIFDASFDQVKIKHQVKRGNRNHEDAESDTPRPAFMDERDRTIEIAKNHIHEIQNRDASGCGDDADLESLSGADDSGLISEQQNKEGTESQSHGLNRDAGVPELNTWQR